MRESKRREQTEVPSVERRRAASPAAHALESRMTSRKPCSPGQGVSGIQRVDCLDIAPLSVVYRYAIPALAVRVWSES